MVWVPRPRIWTAQPQSPPRLANSGIAQRLIYWASLHPGARWGITDLVSRREMGRNSVGGSAMVAGQRLHDFLGGTNFTFDTPAKLQSGRPFAVTWLQKPGTQTNAYPLLFSLHMGGSDYFAVFQSPSDSSYSFVTGRLGSLAISFASAVGLMTSGTVDRYLVTSSGGPLSGTASDWTLWRNGERLTAGVNIATYADSGSGGKIGANLGGTYPYTGQLGDFGLFDGVPSPGEIKEFFRNPHGSIYAPRRGVVFMGAASGGNTIAVPAASLTLTGFAPAVVATAHQTITVPAGSLTLTGYAPAVNVGANNTVQVPAGALTLSAFAPTVAATAHQFVSVPSGALSLSAFAPTVAATNHQIVQVPAGALTLSGFAPAVVAGANQTIPVPLGALSLTGYAPTVITDASQVIQVPAGALTLSAIAPTVVTTANQTIPVPAGAITITGYAPVVTASDAQTIAVPAGSLTLTGFAPAVVSGQTIAVPAGSLALTGYAPMVAATGHQQIVVPAGTLSLAAFAPSVSNGEGANEAYPLAGMAETYPLSGLESSALTSTQTYPLYGQTQG